MEQSQSNLNIDEIQIVPLEAKAQIKGAFSNEIKTEYAHLVNYLIYNAWTAQKEDKSRTYLIYHDDVLVGYFTISLTPIEFDRPGAPNASQFKAQGLTLGKLLIAESCRGQGVGDLALRYIIDVASILRGITGCAGVIVQSHESAVRFYERFGFEHIQSEGDEKLMFFSLGSIG